MKKILLNAAFLFLLTAGVFGQSINDPFFDHVPYRGAFGSDEWTTGWANWDPQNTVYPATTTIISGDITNNTTWSSSNIYELQGFVYVKKGAVLTINAGTIIRGDKSSKGTLIIEKGAQIIANGTSTNPIIFTSNVNAGSRDYGDWGGIVLCGKAQINVPGDSALIEGGPTSYYGGGSSPDNNDNSGSIKYVRIEFPGTPLQPNQEINGLTCGGVGNGTALDYIQVSYSGDDSYEFFGGTVNAKHLIAFRGQDDDFDTDYGYSGHQQFIVALRDPNWADVSGSNGFESDNDASGSTNTPQTKAVFSNVSIFGPKVDGSTSINSNYKRALHLRRNTSLKVYNSLFSGFPVGLYIDGTLSQQNAICDSLTIKYSILAGMGTFFSTPSGSTDLTDATERAWFMNNSRHNDTIPENADMNINDPFNLNAPDFMPEASSEILHGSIWDMTGITETNTSSIEANIYPNPSHGVTTIQFDLPSKDEVNIGIYDATGRMMRNISNQFNKGTQNFQMDCSELEHGLYYVKISFDNKNSVLRLIIQ